MERERKTVTRSLNEFGKGDLEDVIRDFEKDGWEPVGVAFSNKDEFDRSISIEFQKPVAVLGKE